MQNRINKSFFEYWINTIKKTISIFSNFSFEFVNFYLITSIRILIKIVYNTNSFLILKIKLWSWGFFSFFFLLKLTNPLFHFYFIESIEYCETNISQMDNVIFFQNETFRTILIKKLIILCIKIWKSEEKKSSDDNTQWDIYV